MSVSTLTTGTLLLTAFVGTLLVIWVFLSRVAGGSQHWGSGGASAGICE